MRLHHLEVTAFGPFADTVAVDFDALSASGLFLLTGATGAGKTSVLDAVCFALYGDVPGDRATARRLRSDQAAPDIAPRVVLDCTLAGRRFTITRSPAWQRPKKRGTGTTPQQASVTVTERIGGVWVPLTSRLDEAGHLVTELVGMTIGQFTQVALLPQGRFQTFLRARSEERHKLLQQLFRTGRFEQVERWLRDHRLALAATSRGHHREVAEVVSRLSEAAARPTPDQWDAHDLAPAADTGEIAAWASGLASDALALSSHAQQALTETSARADEARTRHDAGRELARLQADHARAVSELGRLEGLTTEIDRLRARVDAARRAAVVLPVAALEAEALDACASADQALGAARALATPRLAGLDDLEALLAERERLTRRAAEAAALLPRAQRLRQLRGAEEAGLAAAARLAEEDAALAAEQAELPALVEAARRELDAARRAVDATPTAEAELARVDSRLEAAREHARLLPVLAAAADERRVALDRALALKERWLAIQEERITGMAAELAGRLAVGGSCPVCGSDDHPHPAEPRVGAPDAAAEKSARRRLDDAETALLAHDERVRELTTLLAVAAERSAGSEVSALVVARDEADRSLGALVAAAATAEAAGARVAQLEARVGSVAAARSRVSSQLAGLESARAERTQETASIDGEIAAVLGEDADVAEVARRHATEADQVAAVIESLRARDTARDAHRTAARQARAAARRAGFADVGDARDRSLPDDALLEAAEAVADHDAALAAVRALASDTELRGVAEQPAPDLTALAHAVREASGLLTDAAAAAELTERRATRVAGLVDALHTALATWAPVREELDLATRMSSFAEGKAPDNRLQMRLSAYVLAHRLSQVVAAANARLATMSDRRYTLEHTARRGAGETRGGLSLLVRDDWSGEARDPATLSGGETFVVSLALALGLADVIIHEVGRADLDTLFVDEGFGSLDADTLDDVMDTLDSLRDGGRVVGVVSHVAEMKDRIPTQLAVSKQRRGSTLELVRPA